MLISCIADFSNGSIIHWKDPAFVFKAELEKSGTGANPWQKPDENFAKPDPDPSIIPGLRIRLDMLIRIRPSFRFRNQIRPSFRFRNRIRPYRKPNLVPNLS